MASKNRLRVYHSVGAETPLSTTWLFFAHRTSFYLTNQELGGLKVSLHGRDQRHPSGDHFRIEPDPRSGRAIVSTESVRLRPPRSGWPLRFVGSPVDLGVHAMRIRTTAGACALDQPLRAVEARASSARALVPPPPDGWAADLDLVFEQIPAKFVPVDTFPGSVAFGHAGAELEIGLRSDQPQSKPGFRLRNDHAVILRGETRHRRLDLHPTPPHLADDAGDDPAEALRGVHVDVDDNGILWIIEQPTRTA